jgi:hypothetical protein
LLNKELLIDPNSTFIVTWGFLLVFSLLGDVAAAVAKPPPGMKQKNKHKLDLKGYALYMLLPTPVSKLKECQRQEESRLERAWRVTSSTIFRKAIPAAEPLPWYCSERYASIQRLYRLFATSVVYGIVAFFAVFPSLHPLVVFFTGEYDPKTGILGPKPPFRRWVAPGLLFQLLGKSRCVWRSRGL